jgi:hypothetical protein
MKTIICFIISLCALTSFAQNKAKAEKEFLAALNKLVANSSSQHWAYEEPFAIDSSFHIYGDTISATFKFKTDTSLFRIRYAAPVRKISSILHDMYLIMMLPAKEVQMYEKIGDNKDWVRFDRRELFHIALAESDKQLKLKQAVEKAWAELERYYGDKRQ